MTDAIRLAWREQPPIPSNPAYRVWSSLTENEGAALRELSIGKRVIEIGAAFGFSTSALAWQAQHVWSCDSHHIVPAHGLFGIENTTNPAIYEGGTLAHLKDNLARAGLTEKVTICVGNSQTILQANEPLDLELRGKLDLAFIDGDHSYGPCSADLRNCERLLARPGIIAVHDYGELNNADVKPAVDAWLEGRTMRLIDTLAIIEL